MSVEMKDSGIDWIGEIPHKWSLTRLKFLLQGNLQYGANESGVSYDEYLPRYVRITDIQDNTLRDDITKLSLTEEQAQGYILKDNDILFARSGATVGKAFIYKESYGKCAFAGYLIKASINDKNDARFVYHYTQGLSYDEWKKQVFIQATIQNIGADKYAQLPIPLPTKEEQSRIANFLDKKCAEIDELIALQEQMIAQLNTYKQAVITETVTKGLDPNVKMKDSGVEWIGEIPEHWEIKRIKNVCQCFGRIGFRGYTNDDMVQEGEGAITLSPSNMKNMSMDYSKCAYLAWNKYYESPEIQITNGDVLFVKTGSTFGKSSYVESIPMECTINPQIICFKNHKGSAKYLNYLLNTPVSKSQVDISVVGGTIPTIAQSKIVNYCFPYPQYEEQQSISQYLDHKCKEIDDLISIKKEKIEHLKAYKKSVIYEYVTGKKQID